MKIKVRDGVGPKVRNYVLADADFSIDLSGVSYGPSSFPGVFNFTTNNVQITNLTPQIATVGLGGELIKISNGVARFIVTKRGIDIPVVVDLSDPSVPPTVVTSQPQNLPIPPSYYTALNALMTRSGPEIVSMLGTKPGGAVNMELWSARNSKGTPPTYTRNPNLWCAPLASQLSAAVAYKSNGPAQSYGGILISPRHVLYCDHSKPYAANTWQTNYGDSRPCTLQFVLGNGTVVQAVQLAQTTRRTNRDQPGAYIPADWPSGSTSAPDLCVAVLDRDVQTLGVHVMPIPLLAQQELDYISSLNIPTLQVTQGWERITNSLPDTPISNYPLYYNAMVAVGRGDRSGTPYSTIDFNEGDGDSGTPAMILLDGTLYLERILIGGGGVGVQASNNLDHINAMIAVAENDAIARGKLAARTGITVSATQITT